MAQRYTHCMRCFYHQEKEAVGSCKSCGKGLCVECAADLGKGLACRGRCEADVSAVNAYVDRNVATGGGYRAGSALFLLVAGAACIAFGLTSERPIPLVTVLGGCFVAYGVFQLLWGQRRT